VSIFAVLRKMQNASWNFTGNDDVLETHAVHKNGSTWSISMKVGLILKHC
jgi:hypothetical protein